MEYQYDSNADCAYILINNLPYAYSKEPDETRSIDYGEDGTIVGVELLYVRGGVGMSDLPYQSETRKFLEKYGMRVYV
jgi:uncharacterized protein YuzE